MAALVASFDWSQTPLGPMDRWPEALRLAVDICLSSRFPMFVWWGPQLINIYNDGYIPMLGHRHPAALGRPARETWDDIWSVVGPQADAVMQRGEATWNERVKLVMERKGYWEETYFTWSYSPIRDTAGRIRGLFCAVTEETERVRAEAERDRLATQRQLALDAARLGWWHYDPATKLATFDERYREIFGVTGNQRPNAELLERLHPDDLPGVWAKVEAALDPSKREPYAAEYRIVLDDGSVRWVEARGSATFEGDGDGVQRRATSFVGTVADVTERRRAQDAERELRRKLDAALLAGEVATFEWKVSEDQLWGDRNFERLFGIPLNSSGAASLADYIAAIHPDDRAMVMERVSRTVQTGCGYHAEYRIVSGGQTRWVVARGTGERDGSGRVVRFPGVIVDITDRKRAEEEVRQGELRLRLALGAARMVVWEFDPATGRAVVLDSAANLFGLPPGESLDTSEDGFGLVHPDDVERHRATFAKAVAEGGDYTTQFRMVRKGDAGIVYVEERAHAVRDEAGNVVRLVGVQVDITDRTRIEATLRQSEARFRFLNDLGERTRDLTDPEAVMATVARALGEHLSASRCAYGEVEADSDRFTIRHDYTDGCASTVGDYRLDMFGPRTAADQRSGRTLVIRDVDAELTPGEGGDTFNSIGIKAIVCCPLVREGRLVAMMAVHQTTPRQWTPDEVALVEVVVERSWAYIERARAGRAVIESEARFRQLADAMPQMVWVTRPDGFHEYYNKRWYEFTGVPEGSTDGEGWNGMFHPEDQDRAWAAWQHSLATGEPYEIEYRLRHRSGEYRWTLGRALPIRNASGAITKWFGTCTDIDALKRLQRERETLLESERAARAEAERASEAKSEFLATLSHELRTPLTPVLLTVSLMESHPNLHPQLREDVTTIRRNVELESQLISDLLDLTRITRGKLQLDEQDTDLHLIVRRAIDICQREASAKLTADLRATRHTVRGDGTRLQQVFWNLINNAIKFTPENGTITVRSYDADHGRIAVEVADTGAGIDATVLPRIFDAFEQGEVRSARQQAGLGLGLAISKKLAEAHGGTITASSEGRGRGATFTVELPLTDAPVRVGLPYPPPPVPSASRALHVLLVEDHEPTLRVMERLLRQIGHRVTGVTTVASATAAARQNGFDLIISDLGLPDGSGLDIMRELRDRYAGRSIALTGYGMESDITASRSAGFAEHLTKPVDLAALAAAIRRVSSSARPSER